MPLLTKELMSRCEHVLFSIRSLSVIAVFLVVVAVSCSNDREEPLGLEGEQTTGQADSASATPSAEVGDDGETEVIAQVFVDYWDAKVVSENGPDADPALFDGIATGAVVESQVRRVEDMIEEDQRRIGKPQIAEPEITVDGDTATAVACVDQESWRMVIGGQTPPPPDVTTQPIGVELQRIDGAWLVVEQFLAEEEATC